MRLDFETKKVCQKESDIQKRCWSWLGTVSVGGGVRVLQDYSFHCPNGTQLAGGVKSRARYMASLKAQGFRPGVSDLVIAFPVGDSHGAYIELKRDKDSYGGPAAVASAIRKEQKGWLRLMESVGYWVGVAYGLEEFKSLVRSYLAGETQPEPPFD